MKKDMELKSHWDEDSPDFRVPLILSPEQVHECYLWLMGHSHVWHKAGAKAPDATGLIRLMNAADEERAAQHVRHFLWAMLHWPEHVHPIELEGQHRVAVINAIRNRNVN